MLDLAMLGIGVDSRQVKEGKTELDKLAVSGEEAEKSVKGLTNASKLLGQVLGAFTASAALLAINQLKDATLKYTASLDEISTLVDTATFDMRALSKAALEQAAAFNSQPVTQTAALYQIISAGATSAAQATNTLTAANKLAIGGVTDVATAADGLTSVLNAYGAKVKDATAVSDAMFVAVKSGKTKIAELASSLGVVAPLAAQTGVTFDELAAATAALTKGGISTNVAITGLRAILAAVSKPSEEALKMAKALGLEFNSAALEAKGFAGFLADLQAKTGGNTDALAKLFGGVEALVPVMALSGQAGEDFANILDLMSEKAGATDEAFKKIESGAAFQSQRILSTFAAKAIEVGTAIAQTLTPALTTVADLITGAEKPTLALELAMKALAITITALLVRSLVALAVQAATSSGAVLAFAAACAVAGPGAAAAAVATTALGAAVRFLLGPVGLAITAVGLLAAAWQFYETTAERAKKANQELYTLIERSNIILATQTANTVAATEAKLRDAIATRKQIQAELELIRIRAHDATMRLGQSYGGAALKDATDVATLNQLAVLRQQEADAAAAIAKSLEEEKKLSASIVQFAKDEAAAKKKAADAAAAAVAAAKAAAGLSDDAETKKSEAERERERQEKSAKDFLANINAETAAIGKNAVAVRMLAIEAEAAAADKAGLSELAKKIREAGESWKVATLNDAAKQMLADLEFENKLLGMNAAEREVAIARRDLERKGIVEGTEAWNLYGQAVIDAARAKGEAEFNVEQANEYLQVLQQIEEQTRKSAANMAKAFGSVGEAIGNVMTVLASYATRRASIEAKLAADLQRYGRDTIKGKKAEAEATRAATQAEIGYYGDLASAAKSFFGEKTAAYKALEAAEKAFRAIEFALSVKAMVQDLRETLSSTKNSALRATADGIAAYAKALASLPFPLNLAAGAATLAALGAVGVAIFGGGGAGSGAAAVKRNQELAGTGTVLGDTKAKSESISRSLEIVAKNTNKDLEYSNAMLKALRSIDSSIGAVAAEIARSLNVSVNGANAGLGTSISGPGLLTKLAFPIANLLPGLFSTTVTKKLLDQGLTFNSQSLSDILTNGIDGQTYRQIQTTTKKKAFGFTYSESTKNKTTKEDIDADLQKQLSLLVGSLKSGVLEAAKVLGVTGAEAALSTFIVNLGKISFKDMTGDEIQKQLEAVFSKLGDEMAVTAVPLISELQKVGEGAFETLMRVAREYQTVDTYLSSIGKTFGAVGLSSLKARQYLVDLFGDIDTFVEQTNSFAENFLSDAERLAPIASAVQTEMARLGLSGIKTKDQFKNLVLSLDLSTKAGADMYAALMAVAPAFATIKDAAQELVEKQRDVLTRAYEREADALANTIDRFAELADNLGEFRKSLYSGPVAALSPQAAYQAALAEFNRVAALARAGNEDALGDLQGVSEAYLTASKAYYASSQGYFTDLEAVRSVVTETEAIARNTQTVAESQLDQLKASVEGLIEINESVISVRDAIDALRAAMEASGQLTPALLPTVPAIAAQNDNEVAAAQAQTQAEVNEEILKVLAEIKTELAAANAQRGAGIQEQLDRLQQLIENSEVSNRIGARA